MERLLHGIDRIILGLRYLFYKSTRNFDFLGSYVQFGKNLSLVGVKSISIGEKVKIGDYSWLNVVEDMDVRGKITIQKGSDIGRNAVISSSKSIHIGENVLIAPNVTILDHTHAFARTDIPIMFQGITKSRKVIIGSGSWIGTNSVILPGAKIGKNCVIGCNSTVNSEIPDYSVAVGSPAKVIKKLKN